MFKKKPIPLEMVALDRAITSIYSDLDGFTSDDEEYDRMSNQLVKLMKLKAELTAPNHISPDVMATIATNLAGILLILNFERAGVVTSKALSFVQKLR